jgi:hypothetical protein
MLEPRPLDRALPDPPKPPHPVDRMAEIKAQIAALDREYERLRAQVIAGEVSAVGVLWEAVVFSLTRRTITVADAQRLLPLDLFEQLVKPIQQTNVKLHRRRPPKPVKPPKKPHIARSGCRSRGYRGVSRTTH